MAKKSDVAATRGLFTLTRTGRYLGYVDSSAVRYWIENGAIQPPEHTIGNKPRKYYTRAEVEQIKKQLARIEKRPQRKTPSEQWAVAGHKNLAQGAKYLGMPLATLQLWQRKGQIPNPSHLFNGYYYWTDKELDQIRKDKERYFSRREK